VFLGAAFGCRSDEDGGIGIGPEGKVEAMVASMGWESPGRSIARITTWKEGIAAEDGGFVDVSWDEGLEDSLRPAADDDCGSGELPTPSLSS
jgi:hypothetical protein